MDNGSIHVDCRSVELGLLGKEMYQSHSFIGFHNPPLVYGWCTGGVIRGNEHGIFGPFQFTI
jgi:hypothetical protein